MRKFLAAAAAAIALASAPAAATVRAPVGAEIQPAGEQVDGNALRGGFILPLIGLVAILVTVYLLTRDGTDAEPLSP